MSKKIGTVKVGWSDRAFYWFVAVMITLWLALTVTMVMAMVNR